MYVCTYTGPFSSMVMVWLCGATLLCISGRYLSVSVSGKCGKCGVCVAFFLLSL